MLRIEIIRKTNEPLKVLLHHAGDFMASADHVKFFKGKGECDYVEGDNIESVIIYLPKSKNNLTLSGDTNINLLAHLMSMLYMVGCNDVSFTEEKNEKL